ncbi:Nif3-like dinuclear metal center hexameric protein [Arsenicicoccus piscis]|uniref:Nif3-like dinuclear metal center hexameric protein n=1 Tax=Arsenicicoccus piscis TaxID=673954 RepID=UPI001F4CF1D2|nr:Nif3-like dinuclear metal center hexameric protein [Arsenicicoccus piscis]MCH8628448.1 Nif3-like dinuclear metal center hexameric protein [Arsenicicoccus piscis]
MSEPTTPTLRQVVAVLDGHYPPGTAQSWDRVGLAAGDLDQPVRSILLAVDPTLDVINEARASGADLLVTHHPLLLRGVSSVATTTGKGRAVTALLVHDLALYTAHTNADVATPGVSDALAEAAGLPADALVPLAEPEGQPLGRVGDLPEPLTLADFAARLANRLPAAPVGLRVAGDPDQLVRRVAVAGGAGDDLFEEARASGAEVYVTADLRHHPALEAREESPMALVDAGHWATEWLWLEAARDRLVDALAAEGAQVEARVSTLPTDPWTFLVPTRTTEEPS